MKDEYVKAQGQQIAQVELLAKAAATQIDAAFQANRIHVARLNESIDAITKSVEKATQGLANVELPSERLNSELADFAHNLESLLERLGRVVEAVAQRSMPKRRWFSRFRRKRGTS